MLLERYKKEALTLLLGSLRQTRELIWRRRELAIAELSAAEAELRELDALSSGTSEMMEAIADEIARRPDPDATAAPAGAPG